MEPNDRPKGKRPKLPQKSFLIVEEEDFPMMFKSSVLSSSNRRLAKTKEF